MADPIKTVVTTVSNNITPGKLIAFAVTGLVILAILDVTGITNSVLFAVSTIKAKLAKRNAA